MILGAGIYQVPLIRKARELGVEPVVVSRPGNYPGFFEVEDPLFLDTTDVAGICEAARKKCVSGIVTTGTDVAVRAIGHACDALGLPGITERAAAAVTDKAAMKRAFAAGGVRTAPFEVVTNEGGLHAAVARLGYPVMVKACDVSGSRGITKVSDFSGLRAAWDDALRATHVKHVVVERFVPGTEIGVDGFVLGGELALFAPHRKFVLHAGDVTIPAGHAFPLAADEDVLGRIRRQLMLALSATGLDCCAINADVMVEESGEVSVIEIGGRCGATCIPELISMHFGFDYFAQMIHAALGDPVDFVVRSATPCMAKLLFSERSGRVTAIDKDALDALAATTGAKISLDVAAGDEIHAARNGTDRFGQLVMQTDDEAELDSVLELVKRCVEVA